MSILREHGGHRKSSQSSQPIFIYKYAETNTIVSDETTLAYIHSLHIPPAYNNVVISTNKKAKIKAFGYDSKGRKQIIYAKWYTDKLKKDRFNRIMRLESSFEDISATITSTLKHANKSNVYSRNVQIALIIQLMIMCNFRIGSAVNVEKYQSYGLTTLTWEHIKFNAKDTNSVQFSFIGKKCVLNESICSDATVYKLLYCMKHVAFAKKAHTNSQNVFTVTAKDVNMFIQSFNKTENITSKDIRTWYANVLYIKNLKENKEGETSYQKRCRNAIKNVAQDLHNTPAVCKSAYIFPLFID
jgi:DNA topoisomerase-1